MGTGKPTPAPNETLARIERIILSDDTQNFKPEDKDRIKIAFAEGYMAGEVGFDSPFRRHVSIISYEISRF